MKPGITVITPTGDRPEAFRLLSLYMERQTRRPDQWIVIDDGEEDVVNMAGYKGLFLPQGFRHYLGRTYVTKRTKKTKERKHTLPLNLLEALPLIQYDTIFIMEDDDWYHPEYLEWMMNGFNNNPHILLLGQGKALYYHLPSQRYRRCSNVHHASLCQTAFKSDLIEKFKDSCLHFSASHKNPFIDIRFWLRVFKHEKKILFSEKDYCVGIKGMPGRPGTCAGWTKYRMSAYRIDKTREVLASAIGDDVMLYENQLKQ